MKNRFLHNLCENKGPDQLCSSTCTADQCLCFRYTDTTIPFLLISHKSRSQPSPVTVQPDLCQTWSETLKNWFPRVRASLLIGIMISLTTITSQSDILLQSLICQNMSNVKILYFPYLGVKLGKSKYKQCKDLHLT